MKLESEQLKEIKSYGWKEILPQKNEYMISFERDNIRVNIYLTTGTVTFQDKNFRYDKGQVHNNGLDILEEIFK